MFDVNNLINNEILCRNDLIEYNSLKVDFVNFYFGNFIKKFQHDIIDDILTNYKSNNIRIGREKFGKGSITPKKSSQEISSEEDSEDDEEEEEEYQQEPLIENIAAEQKYEQEQPIRNNQYEAEEEKQFGEFYGGDGNRQRIRKQERKRLKGIKKSRNSFYQLLMGQGKSSVIVPVLCLLFLYGINEQETYSPNNTMIVVPVTLVNQTLTILFDTIAPIIMHDIITLNVNRKFCKKKNQLGGKVFSDTYYISDISTGTLTRLKEIIADIDEEEEQESEASKNKKNLNVEKARNTFNKKMTTFKNICVLSDSSLKSMFLNYKCIERWTFHENVYIYDEIDATINPLKSELNYPPKNKSYIPFIVIVFEVLYSLIEAIVFSPKYEKLRAELVARGLASNIPHFHISNDVDIFKKENGIINLIHQIIIEKFPQYEFLKNIDDFVNFLNQHPNATKQMRDLQFEEYDIHNLYIIRKSVYNILPNALIKSHRIDFGMDNRNTKINGDRVHFAVPFVASETPSQNSEFSDKYYTIIYTIISYLDKKNNPLRRSDISKYLIHLYVLYQDPRTLTKEKIEKEYIDIFKPIYDQLTDKSIANINSKPNIKKLSDPEIAIIGKNDKLIRNYLNYICTKYLKQYAYEINCSMIDILSSYTAENRFGFTGTPNMYIPMDQNDNKTMQIKYNKANFGSIVAALVGINLEYQPNIKTIATNNIVTNLIKVLNDNQYKCFIDVGSFLINLSIESVAKQLVDGLNHVEYVVFIDESDVKKFYRRNSDLIVDFVAGLPLDKIFVLFDQKHTTGQDIVQSITTHALISFKTDIRFRDMAQGVFRMRKLNNGQKIDFVIFENDRQIFTREQPNDKIVNILLKNEKTYNKAQKFVGDIQNARTLLRELEIGLGMYMNQIYSIAAVYNIGEQTIDAIYGDIYNVHITYITQTLNDLVSNHDLTGFEKVIIKIKGLLSDITASRKEFLKTHQEKEAEVEAEEEVEAEMEVEAQALVYYDSPVLADAPDLKFTDYLDMISQNEYDKYSGLAIGNIGMTLKFKSISIFGLNKQSINSRCMYPFFGVLTNGINIMITSALEAIYLHMNLTISQEKTYTLYFGNQLVFGNDQLTDLNKIIIKLLTGQRINEEQLFIFINLLIVNESMFELKNRIMTDNTKLEYSIIQFLTFDYDYKAFIEQCKLLKLFLSKLQDSIESISTQMDEFGLLKSYASQLIDIIHAKSQIGKNIISVLLNIMFNENIAISNIDKYDIENAFLPLFKKLDLLANKYIIEQKGGLLEILYR